MIPVLIVVGAILLDLAFGDPRSKYHPTAWVGTLVARFLPFARSQNPTMEKMGGMIVTIAISGVVAALLYYFEFFTLHFTDVISVMAFGIISIILLKTTIAIRGLEQHGKMVMESLSRDNLDEARDRLSMLVKRNTKQLDKNHVVSGVLETTSENIVDGVTGPLFYFGLFGLPGAFVYRTINTIDSMAGYKNTIFANIGWFGANSDKVLNYVPARITGYVMVLAAFLVGADWKGALYTMKSDGKKTSSPNAGIPMAAMAGALGTRFEKLDHYTLGNGTIEPDQTHYKSAILLMKTTCVLFCGLVTIPLIILLSYVGWWIHV
ncbi:cobalamin biosynthesis protein [Candidatus Nitrosotenuis cloacae]|uniref:Probable cobalamin biosynthesis protein CobD n=1 Tax=Candidatus Nitrosotenuis cloacae TaxID=1603555 RepID=A0A3G1B2H1_9ARCH|nr:cobalamin biosynthesis protein [Candidatus Nitrosotenuis cloacae]AJZ75786.1 cobalamin biosynthesis protein [Candidatus Nitrosotenuis cloacae]